METPQEPTKSSPRKKVRANRGPLDPITLHSKEERDRYSVLKSHPIHSTHVFDWECVRMLGYEEQMRVLLEKLYFLEFVSL